MVTPNPQLLSTKIAEIKNNVFINISLSLSFLTKKNFSLFLSIYISKTHSKNVTPLSLSLLLKKT